MFGWIVVCWKARPKKKAAFEVRDSIFIAPRERDFCGVSRETSPLDTHPALRACIYAVKNGMKSAKMAAIRDPRGCSEDGAGAIYGGDGNEERGRGVTFSNL